jgi:membrane protease subunit HflC
LALSFWVSQFGFRRSPWTFRSGHSRLKRLDIDVRPRAAAAISARFPDENTAMKNLFVLTIGVLLTLVLLLYMFAFQVRYDEVAVVATFGKVTEPTYDVDGKMSDAGSVRTQPGLYRRWPMPIQRVYTYPTRVQILQDQLEQQQTADQYSVIVRAYVAWKIADPLQFRRAGLGSVSEAQTNQLQPLLSSVVGSLISSYQFNQLVNIDPAQLKLVELEKRAAEQMNEKLQGQQLGIVVEQVGIRRLVLPEAVTTEVFNTMKQTRQRLASETESTGEAEASRIRKDAERVRDVILSYADTYAEQIRSEGVAEVARLYQNFQRNQELAVFLRQLEALKEILKNNTTFVLDPSFSPIDVFAQPNPDKAQAKPPMNADERK